MNMNRTIAEINWTVEDVFEGFKDKFHREPTEKELEKIVSQLDIREMKDRGLSAGFDVMLSFLNDKAPNIIKEIADIESVKDNGQIYSFTPFGYEGNLVSIETDLRRGIPAVDFVGISDGQVAEHRMRVEAAIKNSGLTFPQERVLQSFSPADLKKDNAMALASALDIIKRYNASPVYNDNPKKAINKSILVLGDLKLHGEVTPVRGAFAAAKNALEAGITHVICDENNAKEISSIPGLKICAVNNLEDATRALYDPELFKDYSKQISSPSVETVEFDESLDVNNITLLDGLYDTAKAIEIACAGKHNIMCVGSPGTGKTMAIQGLMPYLTPLMTNVESQSVTRVWSLAGLSNPKEPLIKTVPFRIPHQTASIEGMCGGGPTCRPGEISLAHHGILFLDEAAEFRSSVLQMLRVPLENHTISLSRAGRTTVYPANFQLVMACNPCPCGNCGSTSKVCLCSAKSVDQYWKKFSAPLLDRVAIRVYVDPDPDDKRKYDPVEGRKRVKKAIEIQRARGVYNNDLTDAELTKLAVLDDAGQKLFENSMYKEGFSPRAGRQLLCVALTIANLDGRERILTKDLKEAVELRKRFVDPIDMDKNFSRRKPERNQEPEISR